MKTVIQTFKQPDLIQRTSPVYDNAIQDAKRILFYFPGGNNTLVLSLQSRDTATVFVPTFSNIRTSESTEVVRNCSKEILAEFDKLALDFNTDFLFNTDNKTIVTRESFIDYTPTHSTKNCLFVLEGDDGKTDNYIRHLADQTEGGILQFLALIMAKGEMAPPISGLWTTEGKALLSFLIAKRHNKPYEFNTISGPWSSVAYSVRKNNDYVSIYNQPHYRLDKALEIIRARASGKTVSAPSENPSPVDLQDYADYLKSPMANMSKISLSDLVSVGADSFTMGGYGLIEVEIDVSGDVYQKIVIDGESGICFVTLQKGKMKLLDEIRDELDADNVEIVGDLAVGEK